jgi:hypothetical protein
VFALPAVAAVIHYKWATWAQRFLLYELAVYLAWLAAFTAFSLLLQVGPGAGAAVYVSVGVCGVWGGWVGAGWCAVRAWLVQQALPPGVRPGPALLKLGPCAHGRLTALRLRRRRCLELLHWLRSRPCPRPCPLPSAGRPYKPPPRPPRPVPRPPAACRPQDEDPDATLRELLGSGWGLATLGCSLLAAAAALPFAYAEAVTVRTYGAG